MSPLWALIRAGLASALCACSSATAPASGTIPDARGKANDAERTDAALSRASESGAIPGPDGSARGDGSVDCPGNVLGVSVDERELSGYPSYAVDGCTLVYVSRSVPPAAHGELRARDLTRGDEQVMAPAEEAPRRPTVSGQIVAWEATVGGVAVVRVSYRGIVRTLTGPFDHAGEPRAAVDGVAFTIWTTADPLSDTDVDLYLPETDELVPIAAGIHQQRFPDISSAHIAFTDFSEDPDGRYDGDSNDLADIAVYDRSTHETIPRPLPDKQAFPMLLSEHGLAYLHWDWVEVHPEPKLAAYHLRAGSLAVGPAAPDHEVAFVAAEIPPYVRPAAHLGTLEWVDSPNGAFRLWRAPADLSWPPVAVDGVEGVALYAPAPTGSFTVLATRASFAVPAELAAVAR